MRGIRHLLRLAPSSSTPHRSAEVGARMTLAARTTGLGHPGHRRPGATTFGYLEMFMASGISYGDLQHPAADGDDAGKPSVA